MADKIGMHVSQLKRYEAGSSQPTIDVFRRIAIALNVSADMLLFEQDERGPDDRLKLQFEAVSQLDEKEREAVETMIAGALHMHDASAGRLLFQQLLPRHGKLNDDCTYFHCACRELAIRSHYTAHPYFAWSEGVIGF